MARDAWRDAVAVSLEAARAWARVGWIVSQHLSRSTSADKFGSSARAHSSYSSKQVHNLMVTV